MPPCKAATKVLTHSKCNATNRKCVSIILKKKNSSSFPDFTAHKNHISGSGKIEIAIRRGKEWERVRNRGPESMI